MTDYDAKARELLSGASLDPIWNAVDRGIAIRLLAEALRSAANAARAEIRERCAAAIDGFAAAMASELDEATGEREAFRGVFKALSETMRTIPLEPPVPRTKSGGV